MHFSAFHEDQRHIQFQFIHQTKQIQSSLRQNIDLSAQHDKYMCTEHTSISQVLGIIHLKVRLRVKTFKCMRLKKGCNVAWFSTRQVVPMVKLELLQPSSWSFFRNIGAQTFSFGFLLSLPPSYLDFTSFFDLHFQSFWEVYFAFCIRRESQPCKSIKHQLQQDHKKLTHATPLFNLKIQGLSRKLHFKLQRGQLKSQYRNQL